MSYVNKIVLNGIEVQLNSLEGLQDAEGHNRFIGDDLVDSEIEGLTLNYSKWSLSGTHLMLVLSYSITAQTSLSNYTDLAYAQVPEWVISKIATISGQTNRAILKDFNSTNQYGSPDQTVSLALNKDTANNRLYIQTADSVTLGADTYLRIQFDLLIDND